MADFLACLCGLITSLLTGVLLWFVAVKLHYAIHKMTLWFVIPAGALLSGWAAASGYYFAYRMYQRRPGRLLLPYVIITAVGSFLLIYYLNYLTFRTSLDRLDETMSFLSFLDLSVRSTTIDYRNVALTSQLGYFGYVTTFIEVLGFAFGGLGVWGYLRSKLYCDRCSWRLTLKGKQVRYTLRNEEMRAMAAKMTSALKQGNIAQAIQQHTAYGSLARYPYSTIRSVCTVYACRHCSRHTTIFELQRTQGEKWLPISESITLGHTDSPVGISR